MCPESRSQTTSFIKYEFSVQCLPLESLSFQSARIYIPRLGVCEEDKDATNTLHRLNLSVVHASEKCFVEPTWLTVGVTDSTSIADVKKQVAEHFASVAEDMKKSHPKGFLVVP